MTPAEIAAEIRAAVATSAGDSHRLLKEALDALSDGLPGDHVETILQAALKRLEPESAG